MAERQLLGGYGGMRIYHDKKGQAVYFPLLSKDGYIITNSDMNKFSAWSMRIPVTALLGMIICMYISIPLGFGIGIGSFLICEILMRKIFLTSLPIIKDFKKPSYTEELERVESKSGKVTKTPEKESSWATIIFMIISGLAVAIVVYMMTKNGSFTQSSQYALYSLSCIGVYVTIFYTVKLIKKIINSKKK